MFRILAAIGIGGALAGAAAGYYVQKRSPTEKRPGKPFANRIQGLEGLIYIVTGLSIFGLAFTGFWAALIRGQANTRYLLVVHCTLAPIFCLSLAATLVFCAQRYKFDKSDWRGVLRASGWRKVCFWVLMAAALPVILSMVLSMLPLWGTVGQEFLYQVHRGSTLILTMAAIGFIGLSR
ncbi:MAG: hypothetical protein AMJ79_01420 [Phycisphaerae bacterium SM23_30]|nr:MAG: hypothetical protein AMJ79_01420 [Phycisphaerae bacterium SM23_30]